VIARKYPQGRNRSPIAVAMLEETQKEQDDV